MLTNMAAKKSRPRKKVYNLTDQHGLYLRIEPAGGKYWRYKYRFAGKQKVGAGCGASEILLGFCNWLETTQSFKHLVTVNKSGLFMLSRPNSTHALLNASFITRCPQKRKGDNF
jgi:hypothetical protein